jgi:hypothetical protein
MGHINLKKERTTRKGIEILKIEDKGDNIVYYNSAGEQCSAEIQEDQDGEFYFMHQGRAQYIPNIYLFIN